FPPRDCGKSREESRTEGRPCQDRRAQDERAERRQDETACRVVIEAGGGEGVASDTSFHRPRRSDLRRQDEPCGQAGREPRRGTRARERGPESVPRALLSPASQRCLAGAAVFPVSTGAATRDAEAT